MTIRVREVGVEAIIITATIMVEAVTGVTIEKVSGV